MGLAVSHGLGPIVVRSASQPAADCGGSSYWNIEVTFEETRAHTGLETQRQWSDKAISRTTPCVFALYSIVTWAALRSVAAGAVPTAQTAWYRKQEACFSDVLALVRRRIWSARYLTNSPGQTTSAPIPHAIPTGLIDHLAYAA